MSGTIYAPALSLTTLQDRCVIGILANEKTERPRRRKRPNLNTNLAPKHKLSTTTTMEGAGPMMRLPFTNGAQNEKKEITIMDHSQVQAIRKNTKNSKKGFSAIPKLGWKEGTGISWYWQ